MIFIHKKDWAYYPNKVYTFFILQAKDIESVLMKEKKEETVKGREPKLGNKERLMDP